MSHLLYTVHVIAMPLKHYRGRCSSSRSENPPFHLPNKSAICRAIHASFSVVDNDYWRRDVTRRCLSGTFTCRRPSLLRRDVMVSTSANTGSVYSFSRLVLLQARPATSVARRVALITNFLSSVTWQTD